MTFLQIEGIGQRFFVKNYAAQEGLTQSEIGDIVEGPRGYLYLTTAAASGVDMFDGFEFHQVGVKDGLVSDRINELHRDVQGRVWFFSVDGASCLIADSIQSFPYNGPELVADMIFDVWELGDMEFLIASNGGLIHFNKGRYALCESEESLRYFSICSWSNYILLGTDKGLYQWHAGEVDSAGIFHDARPVLAMCVDKNGDLLLGLRQGIQRIGKKGSEFIQLFDNPDYSVISFLLSQGGETWAGTNGHGLYRLGDEPLHIHEGNGLSDDFVWSLYGDKDDNIWIGTSGAGLDLLSARQFRILSTNEGLQSDIVYDIVEREDGSLWFGMVQGGISVLRNGSWEHYGTEEGLSHMTVRCFEDAGDSLLIGTENGLSLFHDGVLRDVSKHFQVEERAIFDIERSRTGDYWFACKGERYYGANGGVVRSGPGGANHFTLESGLPSENVYRLFEDKKGQIWVGTKEGIALWDGTGFKAHPRQELSNCVGTTFTFCEEGEGVWVGGLKGLAYVDRHRAHCIEEGELVGKTIYFLSLQGDSILWVGSASGLEKLDLRFFHSEGRIVAQHYDEENGFYGTECNQNAVSKDRNGHFWFGTIAAAIQYRPDLDIPSQRSLAVSIRDVSIDGGLTDWKGQGYRTDLNKVPLGLQLSHTQNSIQIGFLGVELANPDEIAYSFKLNDEEEWSPYTKERRVFYAGLRPGKYRFSVRARNDNTRKVSEIETFEFQIIPAFWQTWWFRLFLFASLLLLVLVGFIWRIRSVRSHEKELRQFEKKMAELEMTALRSQMNPHFLFNSLNSVNHFIIKNKKEEASRYLTMFSRLVRSVLQNSKEGLISLEEELNALRLYIELESLRFNGEFGFKEKICSDLDVSAVMIPPLTLQPYVENAIWHGLLHLDKRQGELQLVLRKKEEGVEILIEDNGVGRRKAEQLKSKSVVKKKSMGMRINADRMGLSNQLYDLNFNVRIEDLYDEEERAIGTRVIINLHQNA